MDSPKLPSDEKQRLNALLALNILHTPAEERFDRITRLVRRVLDVPIALVSLVSAETQWFKSRQGLDAAEMPRDIFFCGHAILHDDTFEVPDACQDPVFADNPLVTGAPHIRFYAGQPIRYHGSSIGTLCAIDVVSRTLSSTDIDSLKSLALWVERELEIQTLGKAQIELIRELGAERRKSVFDPLTGVWNRRGINELIVRELAEAGRVLAPLTLMYIDVDNFKQINDNHGQCAGDMVLREFASRVRHAVRPGDIVGRYGGDEFLILLPGCPKDMSQVTAERIRKCVDNEPLQLGELTIPLTCSVGAITATASSGLTKDLLIARADMALYRAKEASRNRVITQLNN